VFYTDPPRPCLPGENLTMEEFHEVWWIFAQQRHPWGGLRLAHFRKTIDGALVVVITGEIDSRRQGVRVWADVEEREGWVRIAQIAIPDARTIAGCVEAKLREIGADIARAHGFKP
jgi:hypothetical protein